MANTDDIRNKLVPIPANVNPVPVLAPLAPSQDTTSDQLNSFCRSSAIPFVRHSPLPGSALSAFGAAGKSVSQTVSGKEAYSSSANLNQIPFSTRNQGAIPPIVKSISNLSALSFQGAWSASTVYSHGASVDYLGKIYISLVDANLNNTPSSSPGSWQATGGASIFLGAWSSITAYVIGNQVTYQNASANAYYISLTSNTNHQPDTHPSDWQQIGSPNSDVFLGAYNNATAYIPGNQVTSQGSFWICISATTGNAPAVGSSFWNLLGTSAILLGAWSSVTAYPQGAEVTYINYIFKALQANTNQTPPTPPATNAFWVMMGPANLALGVDGNGNVLLKNINNAVGTTNNPTTSAATFATIPAMAVTITTKRNNVLIAFSVAFSINTTTLTCTLPVFLDGVQVSKEMDFGTANTGVTLDVPITYIDSPSAASHTYDIRWKSNGTAILTS